MIIHYQTFSHMEKMFRDRDLSYKIPSFKGSLPPKAIIHFQRVGLKALIHTSDTCSQRRVPPLVARLQCLRFAEMPCTILKSWTIASNTRVWKKSRCSLELCFSYEYYCLNLF